MRSSSFPSLHWAGFAVSLVLLVSAPVRTSAADLFKVGDTVPVIVAKDQHEKDFTLGDDARWLLISFDMGTGKAANKWFEDKGASYLTDNSAVFVANIHGMPGIGRAFALPKMRRYPHRIILADAENLLDPYPTEKGKITVLKLGAGRLIEEIKFWKPGDTAPLP